MIRKITTITSISAMALMTTLLISTATSVGYAKEYSQSTSQTSECGNGSLPLNVYCSNQQSGIQGDENVVSSTSVQPSQADSKPFISSSQDSEGEQQINEVLPTEPSASEGENNDSENQNVVGDVASADPTRIVLPCCDEMPVQSTLS